MHARAARQALATVLITAACNSSPASPSRAPAATSSPFSINGRVVGTVTGEPIVGAMVALGGDTFVTDSTGSFRMSGSVAGAADVVVSRAGIVTRSARLGLFGRDVTLDVIQDQPPFDLDFFRSFGRNARETESGLEPLRPLSRAPRIHVRTVDEAGRPVDVATLDLVDTALQAMAPAWSDGRFPIETIERGPGTRQGQDGWVTVLWTAEPAEGLCGRATLGTSTGYIELNYLSASCTCGRPARIAPRTVRHELGHVYGYWHTGDLDDLMAGLPWPRRLCDQQPSTRELAHTKYMYARTAGNLDPDTDPGGHVLRAAPPIVVVD